MMLDQPFNKSTLFHGPCSQQHADFTPFSVEVAVGKTSDHEVAVHQRKVLTGHDQTASIVLDMCGTPHKSRVDSLRLGSNPPARKKR